MKKRLMQLTGVLGLLFMVLLGADITSKQSKEFITMTIFANEAKAFGCGADFLIIKLHIPMEFHVLEEEDPPTLQ